MDRQENSSAATPLTEATYFILLSLAPGPNHGYAIMKDVQQLSHDRVVLSTGTLYGALKRLLDAGWISRAGNESVPENGRDRKSYRLTELGDVVLQSELERLNVLVRAAKNKLPEGKSSVYETDHRTP